MLADVVHGQHTRVIECGRRPRFLLEPAQVVAIGDEYRRNDLDRDYTSETGIAGVVHLAHAALAQQAIDLVRSELGALRKAHGTSARSFSLLLLSWAMKSSSNAPVHRGAIPARHEPCRNKRL